MNELEAINLPAGIRSRQITDVNGLDMHVLEAGYSDPNRPSILLLHGFPELAYSWRKTLLGLAEQGYHAVAPDQRGYGRTTGWSADYEADLKPFYILNLVRDAMALVDALGRSSVAAVVGHDFGSPVAAYCALIRPDIFRSVVLMSAPFVGAPPIKTRYEPEMPALLAALSPPKKHYQHYFCTPDANRDMVEAKMGLQRFLRTYFHIKSADWPENVPFVLSGWTPEELVKMPPYYIMGLDERMPDAIGEHAPSETEEANCNWLKEDELSFFAQEFQRTGLQGGLNWYRCSFLEEHDKELSLFSGRTIDVPSCFISGESDWAVFQLPGGLHKMQNEACTDMKFVSLIPGAGHWPQQEQPDETVQLVLKFLAS